MSPFTKIHTSTSDYTKFHTHYQVPKI